MERRDTRGPDHEQAGQRVCKLWNLTEGGGCMWGDKCPEKHCSPEKGFSQTEAGQQERSRVWNMWTSPVANQPQSSGEGPPGDGPAPPAGSSDAPARNWGSGGSWQSRGWSWTSAAWSSAGTAAWSAGQSNGMPTDDNASIPEGGPTTVSMDDDWEAFHVFMVMLTLVGACVLGMFTWELGSAAITTCRTSRRKAEEAIRNFISPGSGSAPSGRMDSDDSQERLAVHTPGPGDYAVERAAEEAWQQWAAQQNASSANSSAASVPVPKNPALNPDPFGVAPEETVNSDPGAESGHDPMGLLRHGPRSFHQPKARASSNPPPLAGASSKAAWKSWAGAANFNALALAAIAKAGPPPAMPAMAGPPPVKKAAAPWFPPKVASKAMGSPADWLGVPQWVAKPPPQVPGVGPAPPAVLQAGEMSHDDAVAKTSAFMQLGVAKVQSLLVTQGTFKIPPPLRDFSGSMSSRDWNNMWVKGKVSSQCLKSQADEARRMVKAFATGAKSRPPTITTDLCMVCHTTNPFYRSFCITCGAATKYAFYTACESLPTNCACSAQVPRWQFFCQTCGSAVHHPIRPEIGHIRDLAKVPPPPKPKGAVGFSVPGLAQRRPPRVSMSTQTVAPPVPVWDDYVTDPNGQVWPPMVFTTAQGTHFHSKGDCGSGGLSSGRRHVQFRKPCRHCIPERVPTYTTIALSEAVPDSSESSDSSTVAGAAGPRRRRKGNGKGGPSSSSGPAP